MKGILLLAMAGILAGCATTAPLKVGKDTYTISSRVPFAGPTGAIGDALGKANTFCASQNKEVQLLTQNSSECALHGGCGQAEVTFLCLSESDPRYSATQMRKDNGVNTIEVKQH